MGRITHCRLDGNTRTPPISGVSGPDDAGFPGCCDHDLASRSVALYRLIRGAIPAGASSVDLRQIDIATAMGLSSVTVRRHTRRLCAAGLLNARRVHGAIRFSLPDSAADDQRLLPDVRLPAEVAPAVDLPAPVASRGDDGPDADVKDGYEVATTRGGRPICGRHRASRFSDYSEDLDREIYHCTGYLSGRRCSWLYVVGRGVVRPYGVEEWRLPELRRCLESADSTPSSPAEQEPDRDAPVEMPSIAPALAEPAGMERHELVWRDVVRLVSETMQDHYVRRYLEPARAAGMEGSVLSVQARCRQDAQWLSSSFNQSWFDEALEQVLGAGSAAVSDARCRFE